MKTLVMLLAVITIISMGSVQALGVIAPEPNNVTVTPSGTFFWEGTQAVGVVGDNAPDWSPGCFEAPQAYSKYGFAPADLFGRAVTVGELASISYFTKKDSLHTAGAGDWFFQMYTQPYDGSPGSSWYGNRINAEPYFSENLTETAGQWTQWVTDAGQNNRLRFFDSSNGYYGSYTDGFLADLTGDSAYANQEIMVFDVALGTAWASGFDGRIDGLAIELTDGELANINFVPEPVTLGLLAAGGLALLRRKRK